MSVSDITPKRPKQMTDERLAELMAMAVPLWVHELFDHIAWQAGEAKARERQMVLQLNERVQQLEAMTAERDAWRLSHKAVTEERDGLAALAISQQESAMKSLEGYTAIGQACEAKIKAVEAERDAAKAECERLRAENAEWLWAAKQAIADMFDGAWKSDGTQAIENDPQPLYELIRGRGWHDTPEPVMLQQLMENKQQAAEIARLRGRLQEILDTHAEQPNIGLYREHGWWASKFKQKLDAARAALEGKTP